MQKTTVNVKVPLRNILTVVRLRQKLSQVANRAKRGTNATRIKRSSNSIVYSYYPLAANQAVIGRDVTPLGRDLS